LGKKGKKANLEGKLLLFAVCMAKLLTEFRNQETKKSLQTYLDTEWLRVKEST